MTEYEFIRAEKASFPVRAMCRTLDASKSGYYEWLDRGPSERQQRRSALAEKVAEAHEASRRTYGSPRIREALVQQGEVVSEKMVASVMQEIGLVARPRRAFRVTTDSRFTEHLAFAQFSMWRRLMNSGASPRLRAVLSKRACCCSGFMSRNRSPGCL